MKKNIFKTLAVTVLSAVSLTAYAEGTQVTKANVICQQYSYIYANGEDDLPVAITNITLADAQAFGAAVSCPTDYWIVVYATDGDNLKWTSNRKTGEQTTTPEIINAWNTLMMNDAYDVGDDPVTDVTIYLSQGLTPYAGLVNTTTAVHFNDYDWYIIADNSTAVDAGTVTLLAADTRFGTSKFHDSSNAYSGSTVKSKLDALTAEGGAFASVKDAIVNTDLTDVGVTGAKLYLLSTSEAEPYVNFNFTGAQYGGWWLRSPDILYDDGGGDRLRRVRLRFRSHRRE